MRFAFRAFRDKQCYQITFLVFLFILWTAYWTNKIRNNVSRKSVFRQRKEFDIQKTVHRDIFRRPCIVIYSEDRASWYIQKTVHRDIFRRPCIVIYSEERASWYIQKTVHRDIFRRPCIVIYSHNGRQRDALFLKFIWQSTLHVSDMSTLHHQEYLNTVYTQ